MFSSLLSLLATVGAVNAIVAEVRVTDVGCAGAAQAARKLAVTNHVIELQKSNLRTASSAVLLEIVIDDNSSTPLVATGFGSGYAITVDFEDEPFLLLFDTGSADTWLVTEGFQCVNYRNVPFPSSYCNFGPLFNGSFPKGPIPNQNFKVSYGSGEFVTGETGLMDISIAGQRIDRQQIALVDRAYWTGDGQSSGITGFAYRALTSSYRGDNSSQDNPKTNLINYDPIVQNALEHSIFETFSLAFERGKNTPAGYLALGGLPPVSYKNSTWARTPIKVTDLTTVGRVGTAYSFYTIRPDGFVVSAPRPGRYRHGRYSIYTPATFDVIVDSGTTLTYLPRELAGKIAAQFFPPAQWIASSGLYEVPCRAIPPTVSIGIGGRNFTFAGEDLVLQGDLGIDPSTGLCIVGIQPTNNVYILGDTFLKGVLTVFDFGLGYMRFAER